nr:hypothetical protein [Rhodococcus sp. (in: high G+C Gram-positive bacteria)]
MDTADAPHLTGLYPGLYAVAYAAGGAAGPTLLGFSVDATSWSYMMLNAAVFMVPVLALFTVLAGRERNARRTIAP